MTEYVSIFGAITAAPLAVDYYFVIETDRVAYPADAAHGLGPHAAAEVYLVKVIGPKRRVYVSIQDECTRVRVDEFVTAYRASEKDTI